MKLRNLILVALMGIAAVGCNGCTSTGGVTYFEQMSPTDFSITSQEIQLVVGIAAREGIKGGKLTSDAINTSANTLDNITTEPLTQQIAALLTTALDQLLDDPNIQAIVQLAVLELQRHGGLIVNTGDTGIITLTPRSVILIHAIADGLRDGLH